MDIGERIKLRRKELKLSADAVAEKLGVSRSTIFRYEKGDIEKLPTNILGDIAEILKTTPAFLMGWEDDNVPSIESIYNQLEKPRQTKVYNFAEYQLKEQQRKSKISIMIKGYVSAGSGEWLESNEEEVEFNGEVPEHDFAVRVNGNSMTPLFDDKQIIFVKGTSEARDGQIVICRVNSDAYVKKLSGNKLVSLNKDYKDILISETDDFKIFGVVVL
ncbi:helix-turn-helix domain-containing protein [Enterococcus gallinarum]|uniref:helix-turn-helix domain-containing protein n=1 Tax=Enterococcus gallinarum TaxID=1353 RepID=UPI00295339CB|nr:S24 family peptidase [Enterococcus gallinarum]MDV7740846.1 S24 family peptidase [Enterococcus gallinarum]